MKAKPMPKFTVTITHQDNSVHHTEGWGVIRKADADRIISSELGLDRARSVMVSNGKQAWFRSK